MGGIKMRFYLLFAVTVNFSRLVFLNVASGEFWEEALEAVEDFWETENEFSLNFRPHFFCKLTELEG